MFAWRSPALRQLFLIWLFLFNLYAAYANYGDRLIANATGHPQEKIGVWLYRNDPLPHRVLVDTADLHNGSGVELQYSLYSMRWWSNDEFIEDDPAVNAANYDFILSSKLWPYKSVLNDSNLGLQLYQVQNRTA